MDTPRLVPGILALLSAAACGGGVTGPEGLPSFSGNYVLEVQASSSCAGLPVTRFAWDVVATTSRDNPIQTVVVALPGGSDRLKMDFTFAQSLPVNGSVFVFNACERDDDDIPIPGTSLSATLAGSLSGQASRVGGGRGEVIGGSLSGEVAILTRGQCSADAVPTCRAADHRWTLRAR